MDLITAFTIGLVGSLHCLGMCGPIAIALPLGHHNWAGKVAGGLLYNAGRIITYGVLGAIFGLLGRGLKLAGLQQWVSILLGIVMILSVLFPVVFREKINFDRLFSGYASRLTNAFRNLFAGKSLSTLLVIGLLNGLLPCGLVYIAVAGAINTNEVLAGVVYMMVFGAGTAPALLALSLAGNAMSMRLRSKLAKAVPVFIVILGILFILRGLNLGVPYVSPKSEKLAPKEQVDRNGGCCR